MSKVFSASSLIFIYLFCYTVTGAAQTDNSYYVKIDYLKAEGHQIGEYLELEQELWKPIHEERKQRGIIESWNLYSVVAGEPDISYNYIVVNVFDDFSKIDYYGLNELIDDIHPDINRDEFMERTRSSREVVRTEIWQINGLIMDTGQVTPGGNYLTINYFDARGGTGEHAEMELDFWGRIHEVRVDRNILNSWGMYTLYYPAGDARHYTYSTIDYYDDLSDLTEPVGMELARIAHPNLSEDELSDYFTRTGESRSLYKTELWKVIDSVLPAND